MSMPKEPRQLMINLMYLVLTAMLALNISSEILNAFKTINNSIVNSNGLISNKNAKTYQDFDINEQIPKDRDRVKPYNDKAKLVKAEAQKMVDYLETWKKKIVDEAGGMDGNEPKSPENIDASTKLLVEKKGGDEIKQRLEQLRAFMLAQVDDEGRQNLTGRLPLKIAEVEKKEENPNADWSFGTFNNVPVMGAITLFSKMQNDVRASESVIIDHLFSLSQSVPFKFDAIRAIATPKTSYVLLGQPVEAEILLAAYNKNVNPTIRPSSGSVVVKDGVGSWKSTANGVGLQTVRGSVSVDMGSSVETQQWSFQYMVGSAGASVQLDNMNVFYVGVPNPVTVTAAGYAMEDVSMSIPGAELKSTGLGKYEVMVPASLIGKTVDAAVNAKDAGGAKRVGGMEVRVKKIPDPQARVGGKPGGGMPAATFRVQDGVIAVLENFEFPARFRVTGFTFSAAPKRGEYIGPYPVNGAQFGNSNEVKSTMPRLKPGDKVFIEEIRGVGPDNIPRRLNDIILTLN